MYPVFHQCKIFVSWLFYWIIMASTSLPCHTLRHIIALDDMILYAAGKSILTQQYKNLQLNKWIHLDPSDLESASKAAQSSTAWVLIHIAWWIIKLPPPTLIDIISPYLLYCTLFYCTVLILSLLSVHLSYRRMRSCVLNSGSKGGHTHIPIM